MSAPSLLDEPIPVLIRRIALPASIGFFFNTMFNFADTFCAGILGTDALAALSVSFPVFFLLLSAGSGLSQGTTALMANAIGAKEMQKARHVFAQALVCAVVIGLLLSGIGLLISPWLFGLLGAEGTHLRLSQDYMNVILLGGTFFILQMAVNAALNAQGDTKLYRNFLIIGFFANCVLNPILMLGWLGLPAMGVAGLALATVIVQLGGCVMLWRGVRRRDLCREMPAALFKPDLSLIRDIVAQAGPAALNMLTVGLGIFVITWFAKHFGKEAVAAYGIATRIEQMVLLPTIGLNFAVLSLVGQNHGAGYFHRVREAWKTNLLYGVGLMLAGGALLFLLKDQALALFTSDPVVLRHGSDYLGVASVTLAAYPILFVTVFALQGMKRPGYGLWMGLYRQIIAPMIVFNGLAFTLGLGSWGLWWGIGLVTWSAALFALWWGWRAIHHPERLKQKDAKKEAA
ncbi:MAG: MATE family efflux transporter [Prosthecobacter sp.]